MPFVASNASASIIDPYVEKEIRDILEKLEHFLRLLFTTDTHLSVQCTLLRELASSVRKEIYDIILYSLVKMAVSNPTALELYQLMSNLSILAIEAIYIRNNPQNPLPNSFPIIQAVKFLAQSLLFPQHQQNLHSSIPKGTQAWQANQTTYPQRSTSLRIGDSFVSQRSNNSSHPTNPSLPFFSSTTESTLSNSSNLDKPPGHAFHKFLRRADGSGGTSHNQHSVNSRPSYSIPYTSVPPKLDKPHSNQCSESTTFTGSACPSSVNYSEAQTITQTNAENSNTFSDSSVGIISALLNLASGSSTASRLKQEGEPHTSDGHDSSESSSGKVKDSSPISQNLQGTSSSSENYLSKILLETDNSYSTISRKEKAKSPAERYLSIVI